MSGDEQPAPAGDDGALEAVTDTPHQLVVRLLAATQQLHTQSIVDALQESRQSHGLVVTLEQVVLPALQEIGRQWAAGTSSVAHEHLLAGAVQRWLAVQQQSRADHRGTIVLACGPEDQHTLAVEAFTVLLADQGYDCRYLGAKTPVSSLVLAAQHPPARAVVVVSHLDQNRAAAVAALHAVAAIGVPVFYAGAAFHDPEQRHDVPAAPWLSSASRLSSGSPSASGGRGGCGTDRTGAAPATRMEVTTPSRLGRRSSTEADAGPAAGRLTGCRTSTAASTIRSRVTGRAGRSRSPGCPRSRGW